MLSQADRKRIVSLHDKKPRTVARRFLVQGRKMVVELLRSTWTTERIVATREGAAFVEAEAKRAKVAVDVVEPAEMDRLGTFENGNELIAVTVIPDQAPFRVPRGGDLVLALDGVRDPRNMGGLVRIADWFGVREIWCSQDSIDLFNPKCVQSTMGSIFRVPVRYARLLDELTRAAEGGASLYVADMAGVSVYEAELARPAVLVLGSESHGLSDAVRGAAQALAIAIPRVGGAESLNVAMAATALCAELARRAPKL